MPIAADVYKKIVDAKVFIDEHFDSPIDLDVLALEACLSRFHFHRLFRRIYRRTPHQYLTFRRIDRAQRMLADECCTVGEVCVQVGFESIGSFSMLFKKETGEAPGEYRDRLRRRSRLTPIRKWTTGFVGLRSRRRSSPISRSRSWRR